MSISGPNKKYELILVMVLVFILGWFLHSYYYLHIADRSGDIVQFREDSPDYKFINPLLFVGDSRNIETRKLSGLEKSVQNYISKAKAEGRADDISFYYRDLNQVEWTGVNQEDQYDPGSLLKVSVLIAYFKLADDNPNILSNMLYYQPTVDHGQTFKPSARLQAGYYPAIDLVNQMIVESDNDALHTLNDAHINEILQIYKDLRLPDPLKSDDELISTREYSRLFRVLYNVGYVSNKYSEEALGILSRTNFKEGLVSGISSSTIAVAHKFGEHTTASPEGVVIDKQLHDCGNVYYPGKPYFICVMTKGQDFTQQTKIISDISKITFNFVSTKK